jgi:predicted site-specific integrase-resolvase
MSDPRLRQRADSEFAVSRDAVDKLKGKLSKFDGLVSTSSAAARILGISSSNFGEYYVRPGRMEPALVLGRNRNYFRLRDIEHILRAREDQDEMLTSQQVADTCGVYISCVYKWTLAGVLKPVTRRSVGEHLRDLYRRKDVEKLLAEREAFKAKRIEEGKTD